MPLASSTSLAVTVAESKQTVERTVPPVEWVAMTEAWWLLAEQDVIPAGAASTVGATPVSAGP